MKLSESGKSKLWNLFYVGIELSSNQIECINNRLCKIDFQEEDFQDSVILSTEEAKRISDALDMVDGYMYCNVYKEDIEAFNKRIEQAQSETQYE